MTDGISSVICSTRIINISDLVLMTSISVFFSAHIFVSNNVSRYGSEGINNDQCKIKQIKFHVIFEIQRMKSIILQICYKQIKISF